MRHPMNATGRAAGAAAVLALAALLPPAMGQRGFPPSPEEGLRKVLQERSGKYRVPFSEDKEEVKKALDLYEAALEKATSGEKLRTVADMGRALALDDWDPPFTLTSERLKELGAREGELNLSGVRQRLSAAEFRERLSRMEAKTRADDAAYPKEKAAYEKLAKRFAQASNALLSSGDPVRQAVACKVVKELFSTPRDALLEVRLHDFVGTSVTDSLSSLAKGSDNAAEARMAALEALASIPASAKAAGATFEAALDPGSPREVRRAAADALEALMHSALG
ncbi:MAG: hypothetical protein K2W96_03275, partial [Gemmataceae bacterium]|nr:hypothetical protein [Gemmataceae bacterium]